MGGSASGPIGANPGVVSNLPRQAVVDQRKGHRVIGIVTRLCAVRMVCRNVLLNMVCNCRCGAIKLHRLELLSRVLICDVRVRVHQAVRLSLHGA